MTDIIDINEEHRAMVSALAKPGQDIIDQLTPQDAHLWHMASALCSEAGELFDAIKKKVVYRKDLDYDNVLEELGDIEFYLEGIRMSLGIPRGETLEHNYRKLGKRYAGFKYSDQSAQDRVDKKEG